MLVLQMKADVNLMMSDSRGYKVFAYDSVDNMTVFRNSNRLTLEDWCKENCKGQYWIGMGFGKFELEEDATLFRLTWV